MTTPSRAALPAGSAEGAIWEVAARAAQVAPQLATAPPAVRAAALRGVAAALRDDADPLVALAAQETGLAPAPRLRGELERTAVQLELFSEVVLDGAFLDVRLDAADPGFRLGPRPDLRRCLVPLGPVLVFAASNFPFAFSVAGGDTAAALAAGCPVVLKAHPGHPLLSRAVADRVRSALVDAGLPADALQLVGLGDQGAEQGVELLRDERIAAASFTGSQRAGRLLADVAGARRRPIPFYGELGSTNPVVVTAGAAADPMSGGEGLASAYAASATMSAGQLCTQPGFCLLPADALEQGLTDALVAAFSAVGEHRLLHPGIAAGYADRRAAVLGNPAVEVLVEGALTERDGGTWVTPTLVRVSLADLLAAGGDLRDEAFGPLSVVVEYPSAATATDLAAAVASLHEGELTATLHASADEVASGELEPLVAALAGVAGRVLFGGWPTGVAVTPAMQHGGPFPATTDAGRSTSVGTAAISRFLRPVVYQGAVGALSAVLPPPLRDDNPWGVPQTRSPAGESATWGT